jgi:isoleucyl-tRNA synthetase
MPKNVDLKSTLNLPHTDFPMKAGLPQNEPKQLAEWEEKKLYHRIQEARAGAPLMSSMMGLLIRPARSTSAPG